VSFKTFKNINIYFLTILIFLNNSLAGANPQIGKLKLTEATINAFYDYISSDRRRLDKFLVTTDGTGTFTWVCPQTICAPGSERFYTKPCVKLHKGKPCKIFAMGRKIKLKGLNKLPKNSKIFKQNDSRAEVKEKLELLGFID
jgi:hypothetical protein